MEEITIVLRLGNMHVYYISLEVAILLGFFDKFIKKVDTEKKILL